MFLFIITELKYSFDCSVIIFSIDAQIRITLDVGVVHNLSQPAALWVMTGDILLDEKVVDAFRQKKIHCVENPTEKEVMEAGGKLLSEMWPLLWKNITIEKE